MAAYTTGDDFVLEYVGQRFSFSRADFELRLERAARRLGLVSGAALGRSDRADLATLAVDGVLAAPGTLFGRALADRQQELAARGEDVVYWLRKLLFRGAWLDLRVRSGLVTAVFDERDGSFAYVSDSWDIAPAHDRDVPSWPPVLADR